jgi:hypothetical protein
VGKVEKCINSELIFILLDTCQYVLDTLTDVAEEYIQKFTRLLRIAVDQESMSGPTGFPVSTQEQPVWHFLYIHFNSVCSVVKGSF